MEWTPERVARLCELWDRGATIAEIMLDLKCSKGTVHGKTWRLGLKRANPTAPGVNAKRIDVARVARMAAAGEKISDVARTFGVTRETITRHLQKAEGRSFSALKPHAPPMPKPTPRPPRRVREMPAPITAPNVPLSASSAGLAPVPRTWEAIVDHALHRDRVDIRSREDLVLYNRARMRRGDPPLAIAASK